MSCVLLSCPYAIYTVLLHMVRSMSSTINVWVSIICIIRQLWRQYARVRERKMISKWRRNENKSRNESFKSLLCCVDKLLLCDLWSVSWVLVLNLGISLNLIISIHSHCSALLDPTIHCTEANQSLGLGVMLGLRLCWTDQLWFCIVSLEWKSYILDKRLLCGADLHCKCLKEVVPESSVRSSEKA